MNDDHGHARNRIPRPVDNSTADSLLLIKLLLEIKDPSDRKKVIDLARSLAARSG
jgi:hypothetical protein